MFSFLSSRIQSLPGSSAPLPNNRLADLPIILAGPILRHVSPTSVSVWLATKQAIPSAILDIYDEPNTGTTPRVSSTPGDTREVRLGANLYLYLITCSGINPALEKNSVFTYNIKFGTADLSSLNYLSKSADGINKITYLQSPLQNVLARPSFITAPDTYERTRIVHSSCRMPHASGQDALSMLGTNLIAPNLITTTERPHLLLLTGDQIYADDVSDLLLFMLDDASKALLNWVEVLPNVEALPNVPSTLTSPTILHPQTDVEFPLVEGVAQPLPTSVTKPAKEATEGKVWASLAPGERQNTVYRPGAKKAAKITSGLTSDKGKSHLMRLGEFYAMYLFAWSDELWGNFTNEEEAWQVLTGKAVPVASIPFSAYRAFSNEYKLLQSFRQDLAHVRRALANIPTYMICDDHEVTDDWFLNLRWSQKILGDEQQEITSTSAGNNIPPPKVTANALGSRIIANGMASYVAFQDWGNRPDLYQATSPKQTVLNNLSELDAEHRSQVSTATSRNDKFTALKTSVLPSIKIYFKDAETTSTIEKDTKVLVPKIDLGFRLEFRNGNLAPNDKEFQIIFLDSRTMRGLSDYTQDRVPELIRTDKLDEVFGPLDEGYRMNILVAPTPIFGKPYVELVQYGLFSIPGLNLFNPALPIKNRYGAVSTLATVDKDNDGFPDEKKGESGFIVDDREAWLFNEKSFASVLRQLCRVRAVVVLSGDVHYAFSMQARIWDQNDVSDLALPTLEKRCVVAQLVASAAKNQTLKTQALHKSTAGFRWHDFAIWKSDSQYHYSTSVPSKVRAYTPTELEGSNRILPGNIPLVSYSFRAIQDNRPNSQRRLGGIPLPSSTNPRIKASSLHNSHTHIGFGQTVNVGFNNIGLVRFTMDSKVIHDILHRQGTSTRHEIDLTPIPEDETRPGEAP